MVKRGGGTDSDSQSVVFVDDGDNPHSQEFVQSVGSIKILCSLVSGGQLAATKSNRRANIGNIVPCEQDLGNGLTQVRKELVP